MECPTIAISSAPSFTQNSYQWIDVDSDNDLDLMGVNSDFLFSASILEWSSGLSSTTLNLMSESSYNNYIPVDFDLDGDMDLIASNFDGIDFFRNNNGVSFDAPLRIQDGNYGSIIPADFDHDGDFDLVAFSGFNLFLFRNDNETLTAELITNEANASYVPAFAADMDNDGDTDFVTAYSNTFFNNSTKIFFNQGDATFTETTLDGPSDPQDVGDFDNDGDLDILAVEVSNLTVFQDLPVYLYFNNSGSFELITIDAMEGIQDFRLGDFSNDGHLDLGFVDVNYSMEYWLNNNTGGFNLAQSISGNLFTTSSWADSDGNGNMEFASYNGQFLELEMSITTACGLNTPPSPPNGLSIEINPDESVGFSWNGALDNEQGSNGLTYNLYVYRSDGPQDTIILAPESDTLTGFRFLRKIGAQSENTSWLLKGLENGTYCWKVQAIDHSFTGGAWSTTNCFDLAFCKANTHDIALVDGNQAANLCLPNDNSILELTQNANQEANFIYLIADEDDVIVDSTSANLYDCAALESGNYKIFGLSYTGELDVNIGEDIGMTSSSVCDSSSNNFITLSLGRNYDASFEFSSPLCLENILTISYLGDAPEEAQFSWSFDGGTIESGSGSGPYQVTWPSVGAKTISLVIDDQGCLSSFEENLTVIQTNTVIIGDSILCFGGTGTLVLEDMWSTYNWSDGSSNESLPIEMPGIYSVTVTDQNACTAIDSILVEEEIPFGIEILGDTVFCNDGSSLLETGDFSTYQWSTGANTSSIIVNSAGIYGLTVTDMDGCQGIGEIQVSELNLDAPVISTVSGEDYICDNQPVTLQLQETYDSYNWSTGSVDPSITVFNEGNYGVTVTRGECTATSNFFLNEISIISVEIDTLLCEGECVEIDGSPLCNPGVYSFVFTSSLGCDSLVKFNISTIGPEQFPADAGIDQSLCMDEGTIEAVDYPSIGLTGQWTTNSSAIIDFPNAPFSTVRQLAEGENLFFWELSYENCIIEGKDTVTLFFDQIPQTVDDALTTLKKVALEQIDLLNNDLLPTSYSFTLLNIPAELEIIENSNGTLDIIPDTTFSGSIDFQYEVCNISCNACATATVNLEVTKAGDASRPTEYICPNCINDAPFDPVPCLPECYPQNSIIIINRWGDVVFSADPYDGTWNGTSKDGADLPAGSYYYILRLDIGEGEILVGEIIIVR